MTRILSSSPANVKVVPDSDDKDGDADANAIEEDNSTLLGLATELEREWCV